MILTNQYIPVEFAYDDYWKMFRLNLDLIAVLKLASSPWEIFKNTASVFVTACNHPGCFCPSVLRHRVLLSEPKCSHEKSLNSSP